MSEPGGQAALPAAVPDPAAGGAGAGVTGWWRRRWRMVVLTLGVWLIAFAAFCWWATLLLIRRPVVGFHPYPEDVDGTHVVATNSRGLRIHAWWYPPTRNDTGAVLLCHGHGVDHGNMTDLFPFLRREGVGLLTVDFRAHGRSDGEFTSIGLDEWQDLAAVLTEAERLALLPASMPVAAFGRSMGAATLANGAAHLPRIAGFILESSFAELRQIAARDAWNTLRMPDCFVIDLIFRVAAWYTGYDYAANRPVEGIRAIAPRPLLLIHDARDDRATTAAFEALAAAARPTATLVVPEAGHVQAHAVASAAFERAFLDLLASAAVVPVVR